MAGKGLEGEPRRRLHITRRLLASRGESDMCVLEFTKFFTGAVACARLALVHDLSVPLDRLCIWQGRPRGTVGKAPASEARGPGFEHLWLVQRSRWESRPLSLAGNGAGAVTLLIDRKGSVFPRGTGRFLVIKGVLMHPFAVSAKKDSVFAVRIMCTKDRDAGPYLLSLGSP